MNVAASVVTLLTRAAGFPVQQGGQHRQNSKVGGGVIALPGTTDRRQGVIVVAAAPRRPGRRHDGEVRIRQIALGIVASVGGNRDVHEILSYAPQFLVVDAERGEPLAWLGLHEHVGRTDQGAKPFATLSLVEIDHHATLAGVVVPPVEAAPFSGLIVRERRVATRRVAPRRLDQYDVCAHVAEKLAGQRDRFPGEFDDADSVKRSRRLLAGRFRREGHTTPSSCRLSTSSEL